MHLFNRSGTLTVVGVAASFLFSGCQSTNSDQAEETGEFVPPVQAAPVELQSEVPSEEDIAKPNEAELRELEEALAAEAQSRLKEPRSLSEQAKFFGAKATRLAETKQWKLSKGDRTLILKEDSRIAQLDGVKVILDAPLKRVRGNWLLGESDRRIVLNSAFGASKAGGIGAGTIVIDPGHGGIHDGAKNERIGIKEKELALDVSLRLQGHLEAQGFKVVLTRYDDRHIELKDRPSVANGLKADLFVSVHFNAAGKPEPVGLETYMFTPAGYPSSSATEVGDDAIPYPANGLDLQNFELAYAIQKSMLTRLGREDRGVKKGRWAVLKTLECPGVLVECGFVSNDDEALLVSTAGYRERVAQALAEAILGYAGVEADS
ncbi:N-acetylmuramoyl-L-alanine amidase [Pelagicoccus sp. SDUM812005]|uniref:N-acetylmuramoyl-L-alanine amidase n=1 Tax=Pelagicoccus sp. SDUM812005 TaxID=3041257 RepID=UPI00280D0E9F|nr:N-acetylmuramoyl-L-alanine amidase [Pelagicoccus sp. SDUM812005]MDQ8179267.1 N-acetylmuramoyl-L-alanine amidase [Pelagicoccus sp. SDUM812005]